MRNNSIKNIKQLLVEINNDLKHYYTQTQLFVQKDHGFLLYINIIFYIRKKRLDHYLLIEDTKLKRLRIK